MRPRHRLTARFASIGAAAAASAFLLASGAPAQEQRYDLGIRVRAFESAFEPHIGEIAVRNRVCDSLAGAVQAFFGVRLAEVAREIDAARAALDPTSDAEVGANRAWAAALTLHLDRRLVDTTATALPFELVTSYDVAATAPAGATLQLQVVSAAGSALGDPFAVAVGELPQTGELPLAGLPEGDHRVRVRVTHGDDVLTEHAQVLSAVRDLDARIAAVAPLARAKATTTAGRTSRGLARVLRALSKGATNETDIPAARHLRELEQLQADGPAWLRSLAPGDYRIWLQTDNSSVATRLMLPPGVRSLADQRLPVVIARHGAGGSENLFFDAYGAGKIRGLCRERGFVLVAPRAGLGGGADAGAIVAALAEFCPVDPTKVFGIGHSMGAAMVMREASADPTTFCGIALLGGGGSARPTAALQRLPVLIAPGERDFARRNAERLRDALRAAELETLEYRAYEATEHFAIVQVALDDAFAFFDRCLQARD